MPVYYYDPPPVIYYTPAPEYRYYDPVVNDVFVEPEITIVTGPRNEDQAINNDVVDTLANDPRLSGKIGVETSDNQVTLSGVVTTPGQARRAQRDAYTVDGVRGVTNDLRARVGGTP